MHNDPDGITLTYSTQKAKLQLQNKNGDDGDSKRIRKARERRPYRDDPQESSVSDPKGSPTSRHRDIKTTAEEKYIDQNVFVQSGGNENEDWEEAQEAKEELCKGEQIQ